MTDQTKTISVNISKIEKSLREAEQIISYLQTMQQNECAAQKGCNETDISLMYDDSPVSAAMKAVQDWVKRAKVVTE